MSYQSLKEAEKQSPTLWCELVRTEGHMSSQQDLVLAVSAEYNPRQRSERSGISVTALFIKPCYLIFKGYFVINNFVVSQEEIVLSFSTTIGHRFGLQCVAFSAFSLDIISPALQPLR